ncbi:MAG: hypothetical protein ACKOC9_03620, partial [Alphaproteobacteria bacterium]
ERAAGRRWRPLRQEHYDVKPAFSSPSSADGRKLHPAYLFEVKTPAESRGPWDYYKLLQTTPGDEAFRPTAEGNCPIVRS